MGQKFCGARFSTTGTGDDTEQTIPHYLGVVPNLVSVVPTGSNASAIPFRADATNVYVTASTGETYKVTAGVQ